VGARRGPPDAAKLVPSFAATDNDEVHRKHNVGMKGHIGLQIHPGGQLLIRFKDIEGRELE